MLSTDLTASILVVLPAFVVISVHAATEALWLQPSTKWYGVDGTWSSLGLVVGEAGQPVDVTISTSLSEIWVVENGGCLNNPLFTSARGNVFNTQASASWTSLGPWQLGLDYLGQGGNGDYGMDTVVAHDALKDSTTTFNKQLIAAINDTDYYTGFFGLGITPGRFDDTVAQSPISSLVEQVGAVPSHSYGYTAGASYMGSNGTPLSLTLGGYDKLRFAPHSTVFSLNATTRTPDALIRGISASVSTVDKKPAHWDSLTMPLLSWNESVVAIIDTSTPFLWLPGPVCDHFAAALNLTWNPEFDLYTFPDNAIYDSLQADSDISLSFSVSSSDNKDNFGQPLDVPGVVNITISAKAFAQTLRYPFMNRFDYGDPAVPYFALRRANNGSPAIIGRAFMQEAYLMVDYEEATFSLHEARFPDNPDTNISIETIEPSPNSPYPPAAPSKVSSTTDSGVSKPALIGAIVGVTLVIGLFVLLFYLHKKRKTKSKHLELIDEMKDNDSSIEEKRPKTPVRRILLLFGPKRSKGSKMADLQPREVPGSRFNPVEVDADHQRERHELPVPLEPIELDATDTASITGTIELGTEETSNLTPYEIARRRMEQQLRGPVPEYTPSQSPIDEPSTEKSDVSAEGHYRPSDHLHPSSASSITNDPYPNSLPSPITPTTPPLGEWDDSVAAMAALPSPITFTPPLPVARNSSDPGFSPYPPPSADMLDPLSVSRSYSSHQILQSPGNAFGSPFPRSQRAPIDPTRVVCLGPLPDNVRLSPHSPIPRIVEPVGQDISIPMQMPMPMMPSAAELRRDSAADTLGSNFTMEEEERIREEMTGQMEMDIATVDAQEYAQAQASPPAVETPPSSDTYEPPSPSFGRIDGPELIHVPQPAARRYSWEQ